MSSYGNERQKMDLEQRDLSEMLEAAVVAARLAGQKAIEEIDSVKITIKNGNEIATQADVMCQKIIIDTVKSRFPDHGFIAEEGADGKLFKQLPRGDKKFWWVIDPIDGTNNFAHKLLFFCVSIAVVYKGEPLVGVIFNPATDSIFTAVSGGDAQLNGRRIESGDEKLSLFAGVGMDSCFDKGVPGWVDKIMQISKCRNMGSTALQLAYVASGGLAATIATCPKIWDIAAGALIAECAGAKVTNFAGRKIFPFDLESYNGEPLEALAANKKVHPELLKILK